MSRLLSTKKLFCVTILGKPTSVGPCAEKVHATLFESKIFHLTAHRLPKTLHDVTDERAGDMSICPAAVDRTTAENAHTSLQAENEDLITHTPPPGSKAFVDLIVTDKSKEGEFGAALKDFEGVVSWSAPLVETRRLTSA